MGNIEQATHLLESGKSVAAVTDELGYRSPTVFGRAFRQRFGISPTQWLKERGLRADNDYQRSRRAAAELRLARAQALLLSGERKIGIVAQRAGFSSPQAVNNAFRRKHGLSPTAWVNKQRTVPIEVVAMPIARRKKRKD